MSDGSRDARRFLNVGSGHHPLAGFVNVDLDPGADVPADVTRGLPFEPASVHGIYSEHFIEHLTQAQGAAFFRECRRVLVNGGRVRVATPDLDFLVDVYTTDWRRNMDEWTKHGYAWIGNRAEQLNLVMREWEHRWLYNEEELVRIATLAGLTPVGRCRRGESSEPRFQGIEHREGSTLVYEFAKVRPEVREDDPLVSVVITAFNPRWFDEALRSALRQTYRHLEIVIGDDQPSGAIGQIVAKQDDPRIRYHRNASNLGEKRNLIECFARARGAYIKFLNDDDLLEPGCVERMVRCLNRHPDVTLVTSHRRCIDERGNTLSELAATRRPVTRDCVIDGVSLARAVLESGLNVIGEPSTVMFRRADLATPEPNLLSFAGRECIGTVDVTMWTSLLSRGDAIYLTDTLSSFRRHSGQAQQSTDYLQNQAGPARQQIVFDARRMGLLEQTGPLTLTTRALSNGPALGAHEIVAPVGDVAGPRVSIVIPVWNQLEYTRRCLDALRKNTPAGTYQLVIVDNGSTDGTDAALRELPEGTATIVTHPKNLGFSKACNHGAAAATGAYVLFLNNDTEPGPGWLEPLVAVLDADPSVAAVGSKLLYPDGTIQHAGVIVVEDRPSGTLIAAHAHHHQRGDLAEASRPRVFQALTAACLLVRRSAFEDAGGFDEGYWNGYEDVDLCFTLGRRGGALVYQPESVVVHHESKSGPERFRRVDDNVRRLQQRWKGKVTPDVVREPGGAMARTDGGFPRTYAPTNSDAGRDATARNREAAPRAPGVVSIVILTCNQLRYTKECVASIARHTPEPHELVFVDNGSTDGTVTWLRRQAAEHPHVRLIENDTNLGFAKGCNQGMGSARGEYVMLLNNDVVVTPGWLSGMLECLRRDPDAGFVGPMTNSISGPQRVPSVDYASPARGLDDYAAAFRERNRGRRIPMRRVVGFCMLFRSDLVETVGLLDERFGSGNFEDDDLCLRAAALGKRNVVAGDVFIHHHGSRTFLGNRIHFAGAMTGNRRLFTDKWGAVPADSPLGTRLAALAAVEAAADLHARGETEAAIERLVQGLRSAPAERLVYEAMIRTLIEVQRFTEALEVLDSMPGVPGDPLRVELEGYAHEGLGHLDEADRCAERLLAHDPRSARGLNLQGVVAYHRGDRDTAVDRFQRASETDPADAEPVKNLGMLEWSAGHRDAALERLERSFVLAPHVAGIATAYHAAVTELGAWERATRVFVEAHALHPRSRPIAHGLIDVLLRQRRDAEALERIEEAMLEFGIDDGILAAALDVRSRVGPHAQRPAGSKARVSLCMIVRDEEPSLARCLAAIRPAVAEIVVVDTGSTDRTRDIAAAFGARVYDHAWTGDFSEARNAALAQATGEWILVLDADESIAAHELATLVGLAGARGGKPRAWSFVTRNYVTSVNTAGWTANDGAYPADERGTGWFPSTKVRLFPNRPDVRFADPVHETVEASLARLGIPVKPAEIPVHHHGKLDEQANRAKGEAYYALGRKKLEASGDDPVAISELAIQARMLGKHDEAVELWRRALRIAPELALAWFNLGAVLLELERWDEALEAARRAYGLDPAHKEIAGNYALAELYAGEVRNAIAALERLSRAEPDYPVAKALLAAAWCCAGHPERGEEAFAALRRQGFAITAQLATLARNLARAGQDERSAALAESHPGLALDAESVSPRP